MMQNFNVTYYFIIHDRTRAHSAVLHYRSKLAGRAARARYAAMVKGDTTLVTKLFYYAFHFCNCKKRELLIMDVTFDLS